MAADAGLADLLADADVVVTCGAGGVGKTTTAAALAVAAATATPRRVLVLTVDPARRLATAMGLDGAGALEAVGGVEADGDPGDLHGVRVPDGALATAAGAPPRGELRAAALDVDRAWDALVARHAPDAATRDAILANPLYRVVTGRFVQSHDYVAVERLHELRASGRHDLIVVDTPPTRHAIDLLDAPRRMADFFRSRLLRVLVAPARSRAVGLVSRPFTQVADAVLGRRFLEDVGTFFSLLQTMGDGFVQRAEAVAAELADPRTAFVVVATPEQRPIREAAWFLDELAARRLRLGAVVLNRSAPAALLDPAAGAAAERLAADPGTAVAAVVAARPADADAGADGDPPPDEGDLARALAAAAGGFLDLRVAARAAAARAAPLGGRAERLVVVPELDEEVDDLAALARVGRLLTAPGA